MIQAWLYDVNRVYTETILVEEICVNMTTTPLLVDYIKPTLNEQEEWVEGATQEEIDAWNEANKPEPTQPDKNTIRLDELEQENKLLKAQVEALNATTDFQEDCLAEMAMLVYA